MAKLKSCPLCNGTAEQIRKENGLLSLIRKLHDILNLVKDFDAGYDSNSAENGKMLIVYKGKRYFLKLKEVENPSENVFDDIDRLKYFN